MSIFKRKLKQYGVPPMEIEIPMPEVNPPKEPTPEVILRDKVGIYKYKSYESMDNYAAFNKTNQNNLILLKLIINLQHQIDELKKC